MVILGLLLVLVGVLAVIVALFEASGDVVVFGNDLTAATVFLFGVGAGVAILFGISVIKFGTRRSLQRRRESKELSELSAKLEKVEAERRDDDRSDDRSDDPRV